MNAELFIGDADGPEHVITAADNGTPLVDCRGWMCGNCDALYATKEEAELCCVEPDLVTGESFPNLPQSLLAIDEHALPRECRDEILRMVGLGYRREHMKIAPDFSVHICPELAMLHSDE